MLSGAAAGLLALGLVSSPATFSGSRSFLGVEPFRCRPAATPWSVQVKACSTPLVGEELDVRVMAFGGPSGGLFRVWICVNNAGLEPTGAAPEWTDSLAPGGIVTHTIRMRVTGGLPIRLTAKVSPLQADLSLGLLAEAPLILYPFDRRDGSVKVQWDANTLRPLSETVPTTVTFANGDTAILYREP